MKSREGILGKVELFIAANEKRFTQGNKLNREGEEIKRLALQVVKEENIDLLKFHAGKLKDRLQNYNLTEGAEELIEICEEVIAGV